MKSLKNYELLYKWHIDQAYRYEKKIKDKIAARWYYYKKKRLICGIDKEPCRNCCIEPEEFEKYGCMYIHGYIDY